MTTDGRVRLTLPVRYRAILHRHRGSMSDAGFLAWVLDNIDRGVLAVGVEPTSTVVPLMPANAVPLPKALSVVSASEPDDEFEDVI
ncbi:MAG: hypothetical protein AAF716_03590 [Cyanobacteria bacterium P01_D01_bin.1]